MSAEWLSRNALEQPAIPDLVGERAEAVPRDGVDAVGTERSDPERSDGERSGVETASTPSAPPPASPGVGCVGRALAAERGDDKEVGDIVADPGADAGRAEGVADEAVPLPRLSGQRRGRGRRLVKPVARPEALTPAQRLLLLDTWKRSGLPAGDFAALVGVSKHTLYSWQKKFAEKGPAGLLDKPRAGPRGSQLPELTKRTILMLKQANPEWGCQRISDLLVRGPALPASPSAVARVLHEAGYELEEVPTRPHPDRVRHFERAKPNQLWQTDLFTFVLKRQNRRVYLVAFMDDHSRFLVGYGLHASQSAALVIEVLRAALGAYGTPEEILTDNGTQYVTWRGKSAFSRELEKRGIQQIVASPRRPQTLGKIERFWGTLWRECVEAAVFVDLGDAQRRIGHFIDHYNFQRPHQGIDGLVPADRFFGAAAEVKRTLAARVQANALELARQGLPKAPFYLTGQVGGQPFSVHAEGERVILTRAAGERHEIDFVPPVGPACDKPLSACAETTVQTIADKPVSAAVELPLPVCPLGVVTSLGTEEAQGQAPGTSPLDEGLERVRAALPPAGGEA